MAEKKSKLAEIKTKPTTVSVEDFINALPDEQKRKDSFALVEMMKNATGEDPVLWGSSIIGFGNMRYKSPKSGREVDWLRIGFSPRKANLSLYIGESVDKILDAYCGWFGLYFYQLRFFFCHWKGDLNFILRCRQS